jgi:hypothetical protein
MSTMPLDFNVDIDFNWEIKALEYFLSQLTAAQIEILRSAGIIQDNGNYNVDLVTALRNMFDAGYGMTASTIDQIRSMNSGARQELREKAAWIRARIDEGYTREEARHLYYEWASEGDDPQSFNPNKTLSDEIIDSLYADYQAGNTPNAVAETTGPTQKELLSSKSAERVYDKDGNLVSIRYNDVTYSQDDSGQWVPKEQTVVDTESEYSVTQVEATEDELDAAADDLTNGDSDLTGDTTTDDSLTEEVDTAEVERPEGTIDVADLSTEEVGEFWEEIKESLGGIAESVKDILFGSSGIPSTPEDFEKWLRKQVNAPIAVTFDPTKGVTLDLRIPVGFEVNGAPIELPIFDADGNLVIGESVKNAVIDATGAIIRAGEEIGNIFTDGEGNIVLDVINAGQVVLEGVGLTEEGVLTGALKEYILGELFYNEDTNRWEEEEEEPLVVEEPSETPQEEPTKTTEEVDDPSLPITETDEDDDTQLTSKLPAGRVITDKDGNPIYVEGTDGNTYGLNEDGSWEVIGEGEGDGGFFVSEGTTTEEPPVVDEDPTEEPPVVDEDPTEEPPVVDEDPTEEPPVVDEDPTEEPPVVDEDPTEEPPVVDEDPTEEPPVVDEDPTEEPPVEPPVVVIDPPVEPPEVVDPTVEPPNFSSAGSNASRGGLMGGISYNLPQFVGVAYQPRDYDVELNRIINESLFKGII